MTQYNLGNVYTNRIQGEKAENLEQAIDWYEQSLQVYKSEPFPYEWASTQNNLGIAYNKRIRGEKAENLELAIACHKKALEVRTRHRFPEDWASSQNNLGNAYSDRIQGHKDENLELAIACNEKALEVYTSDRFPEDWAMTQNNLGSAYSDRIQGQKAANLEQAISCYEQVLQVYTRDRFPYEWARTQNNLGNAYADRILGEKAENLELAINCCQEALKEYTHDRFPYEWARTQNNLGNNYSDRIRGEKAENLELAIECFREALTEYTRECFPEEWAKTQSNLGNVYRERIRGERADNFELAIDCCREALKEYTRDRFSYDWARTQNNLANAYLERMRGERAENLELAIGYYQETLEKLTRDRFPYDWARTQNKLASAYRERIRGEKAENLELAIACYYKALKVSTRDCFPYEWARTQNNLGNTFTDRIRGDKAENLEVAIRYLQEALEEYTRNRFPEQWATTQHSLGMAYSYRIWGNKAENLELAIASYEAALTERTQNRFPYEWAMTQNNLALAHSHRIRGNKAENFEFTIAYHKEALEEYTRDRFPESWAMTQHNLGITYSQRLEGDKLENLEMAIACYQEALTVYTRDLFPPSYTETSFNLGLAYQDCRRFADAYNIYKSAIDSAEFLRGEIVSGDEIKQKLAEQWNKLYQFGIVEVCLELNNISAAVEYAERSKTRNLVELILNRDLKTIFPLDIAHKLEELREEITSGQYEIQNATADNPTVLAQHLQQLRQRRNELQNEYLPIGYGFKFDQFQATLDDDTAIIQWYITFTSFETFIITRHSLERLTLSTSTDNLTALEDWANEYLGEYNQDKNQWINNLASRLSRLPVILHLEDILKLVPDSCLRLILIPHRYLHLFPLHALPIQDSCLLELFPKGVSYAPSCQLLQLAQQRQRENFESIFAIQNPTEDLLFTDLEVNSILPLFSSHQALPKTQATKSALSQAASQLQQANYLHFSCHGLFNPNSPLDSCLVMAGANEGEDLNLSKCLTLGNLFDRNFDLNQCRLVTLSACETGLIDFKNTSDEYIGLSSGFIYAGAKSVVSSLWAVKDVSTALLMIRFYQNLKAGLTVAVALNQAQVWLRDSTQGDLWEWTQQLNLAEDFQEQIRKQLSWFDVDEIPFGQPVYWAAFCGVGS
ncbi:MAG: CHAT domain-containing tetratricopeptide repeat protein [Nostoc sp. ChiQUE01a]|nr:CHAT domain-containing tetratricopeptide repeat protein [Nostoc sp. ChiQUE01a]